MNAPVGDFAFALVLLTDSVDAAGREGSGSKTRSASVAGAARAVGVGVRAPEAATGEAEVLTLG